MLFVFSAQLEEQVVELREKLSRKESDSVGSVSKLQAAIQGLKGRLKAVEKEKERALKDKENLLDEVRHVKFTFALIDCA